jgi:hypothetical protein
MASEFEQNVQRRRENTPWASLGLTSFGRDMALHGAEADEHEAKRDGHDPQTYISGKTDFMLVIRCIGIDRRRFLYIVKWTGADGRRHQQKSDNLSDALWRAAQEEINIQTRIGGLT